MDQWGGPGRWEAAPRTRRGGGVGLLLVLLIGAALTALLTAAWIARLVGTGAVTDEPTVASSVVATVAPTAGAGQDPSQPASGPPEPTLPRDTWPALPAPTATDPDGRTLQRSALYAASAPDQVDCPAPALAGTMEDLTRLAGGQLDCLQQAWAPVLASLGYDPTEIPYYFYDADGVETPCGWVEAPALYCSAQGGAIYFGRTAMNGTSWFELGVKEVAGHEYGHHLQNLAGMMDASAGLTGNGPLRRLELQATCFAYAQIARDDSIVWTGELIDGVEPYLRNVVEDGIHGSAESVAEWGLRGLSADDLGACNTWVAASADVD